MQEIRSQAQEVFSQVYGTAPDCVAFAPGSIEILGHLEDLNGGCVLSAALDRGIAVAAGRLPGFARSIEIYSATLKETARFSLDPVLPDRTCWTQPVRGIVRELDRLGIPLKGTRLALVSDLPRGAGLGSSSALEVAAAETLFELYGGRPTDPMDIVRLCARAEETFLDVPPELLEPFSSLLAKAEHVLFLDCSTCRWQQVPVGRDDLRLVLADSGERDPALDARRQALRESFRAAARSLDRLTPEGVRFLRDVTVSHLENFRDELDPETFSRAEHVVRENVRVLRGLAAVKSGNYDELQRLLGESHASSRDLIGNSTRALDFLAGKAVSLPGSFGARLTGPGYGGFVVSLVAEAHVERMVAQLQSAFEEEFSRRPEVIVSRIAGGP
jgi:galactokinase